MSEISSISLICSEDASCKTLSTSLRCCCSFSCKILKDCTLPYGVCTHMSVCMFERIYICIYIYIHIYIYIYIINRHTSMYKFMSSTAYATISKKKNHYDWGHVSWHIVGVCSCEFRYVWHQYEIISWLWWNTGMYVHIPIYMYVYIHISRSNDDA